VAVAEREECALLASDERLATVAALAQRVTVFSTARLEKPRDPSDSLMKFSLPFAGAGS
jgi:hypothetical protein